MNGVLWVLRTGAPWHDLPSRYPPYQTCHRRFLWQRSGRLDRLLQRLAEDLRYRGKIDLSEAFVDATFASAKKGALKSAAGQSCMCGSRSRRVRGSAMNRARGWADSAVKTAPTMTSALTPPSFKSARRRAAAAALTYGITTGLKYFGTTTLVSGDAAFTSARNVCSR